MKYVIHLKQGYQWPIGPGVNIVSEIEAEDLHSYPDALSYGPEFVGLGAGNKRYEIPIDNILCIEITYPSATASTDLTPTGEPKL